MGPSFFLDRQTCDGLGLLKNDLLGDASFPFIEFLPNAGNHSKPLRQGMGHLLPDQLLKEDTRSDNSWNTSYWPPLPPTDLI